MRLKKKHRLHLEHLKPATRDSKKELIYFYFQTRIIANLKSSQLYLKFFESTQRRVLN
jgi:hypothetical protein